MKVMNHNNDKYNNTSREQHICDVFALLSPSYLCKKQSHSQRCGKYFFKSPKKPVAIAWHGINGFGVVYVILVLWYSIP